MFKKAKQTKGQRLVTMIGWALDRRAGGSGGSLKTVGTAVGSIALTTVGASAVINSLRKKD
jgi:hypothetical protein